uniref:Inositol hexakisphosphate and diphosphoinositol-pentakisphosphate kinase n=1 Tax=Phaeomonas parva TaxID=124430 RepID=A0A7S1UJP9_9STRA
MDKKARSKPMRAILGRLDESLFQVKVFGDDTILRKPIEEWPVCDALIAFFSKGFPLDKAMAYAELRKPYCINDLEKQMLLLDRRNVYRMLEEAGINVPVHAIADRDTAEAAREVEVLEYDEYLDVNGTVLQKPVVEKPVNAEDHNIRIYYPVSKGGGCKKLFRKIGDRSSDFSPEVNDVRRQGSYIYEEFLETQGTDVKVYTVGPDYGHAEARKSPALDGVVNRDENGKEVRFPVLLTMEEKSFARRIVLAFGQTVCGFDILRTQEGKSYVCDVNGWSFVKGSRKYYDDCAQLLSEFALAKVQPTSICALSAIGPMVHRNRSSGLRLSPPSTPYSRGHSPDTSGSDGGDAPGGAASIGGRGVFKELDPESREKRRKDALEQGGSVTEELRCIVSVIRHADRSPKQKMKMMVSYPEYLDFFHQYTKDARREIKVKGKSQLSRFLEVTKSIINRLESEDFDPYTQALDTGRSVKNIHKLIQIRSVLGRFRIAGINRKVQLKPHEWEPVADAKTGEERERATKLLLVLKWGGDLTDVGTGQAKNLGRAFRHRMYPDPDNGGILRLHSTFRHDMKIKSSDEGRVMKTAAAFASGMLELEGDLTPILASLVKVEKHHMLDPSGNKSIKKLMDDCKEFIDRCMQADIDLTPALIAAMVPSGQKSIVRALERIGNPRRALERIYALIASIVLQLEDKVSTMEGPDSPLLNGKETPRMMLERWRKLHKDFFDEESGEYDLSKAPDVHDTIRFDVIHNMKILQLKNTGELLELAHTLADCIVPQEYGIDEHSKRIIGAKTCDALLEKIKRDLEIAALDDDVDMRYNLDLSHAADLPINSLGRRVRTRLYFTSESHLHTLLNVLRYGLLGDNTVEVEGGPGPLLGGQARNLLANTSELCYLTQISFRLFEQVANVPNPDDEGGNGDLGHMAIPTRQFRVEVQFSPGVNDTENPRKPTGLVKLHRQVSLQRMTDYLQATIEDGRYDASLTREHVRNIKAEVEKVLVEGGCRMPSPPPPSTTLQRNLSVGQPLDPEHPVLETQESILKPRPGRHDDDDDDGHHVGLGSVLEHISLDHTEAPPLQVTKKERVDQVVDEDRQLRPDPQPEEEEEQALRRRSLLYNEDDGYLPYLSSTEVAYMGLGTGAVAILLVMIGYKLGQARAH